MRTLLFIATTSLIACAAESPSENQTSQSVLINNKIAANKIAANKIAANKIAANKIAANKIAANKLSVNLNAAGDLLSTPDGQEVFSFLVSCALPADQTLVATLPDGSELEFPGEIGLVPSWVRKPLNSEDRHWISACMFTRVNNHDVSIPISLRGPNHALATSADEREGWPLEEGAFYGDMFTPDNSPIIWIACRGRDLAAGDTGGLVDRDCAKPDPANPGFTMCGFTFAGDCADFVIPPRNDFACEKFDRHGTFYENCLDHAGFSDRRHDRDDNNNRNCGDHDRAFAEVITTFDTE